MGANNNTRAPHLFQTLQLLFGSHAKTFSLEQSEQVSVITFFSLAEEKKNSSSKDDKNFGITCQFDPPPYDTTGTYRKANDYSWRTRHPPPPSPLQHSVILIGFETSSMRK